MGNATGKPAHGFHLLRLAKLLFQPAPLVFFLLALGDVDECPQKFFPQCNAGDLYNAHFPAFAGYIDFYRLNIPAFSACDPDGCVPPFDGSPAILWIGIRTLPPLDEGTLLKRKKAVLPEGNAVLADCHCRVPYALNSAR